MPDDVRTHIAAEIRAEMARQHRTQRELAEVLGLPAPSVQLRLVGQRAWRAEELVALADWLGKPVGNFLPAQDAEARSQ